MYDEGTEDVVYYKKKYAIAFYKDTRDEIDERFVECFNNVNEICKYKGLRINEKNLAPLKVELCRALKRFPPTTRMLDGSTMKVYLIDILEDDSEIERLEQERRDKCMAFKKFVQINSSINIEVYASLEAIPVITGNNMSGNRLNAKSGWAKIRVMLTVGSTWYPSEILNWESVKKLAAKEIITIGKQDDTISNPEVLAKAEAMRKAIFKGIKDVEKDRERMNASASAIAAKEPKILAEAK